MIMCSAVLLLAFVVELPEAVPKTKDKLSKTIKSKGSIARDVNHSSNENDLPDGLAGFDDETATGNMLQAVRSMYQYGRNKKEDEMKAAQLKTINRNLEKLVKATNEMKSVVISFLKAKIDKMAMSDQSDSHEELTDTQKKGIESDNLLETVKSDTTKKIHGA